MKQAGKRKTMRLAKLLVALLAAAAVFALREPLLDAFHRYQVASVLNESLKGRVSIVRMRSKALRRMNRVYVYTPPGYKRSKQSYPVIYLLHGCPGQGSDWFVKGRAHDTAERLILAEQIEPVIVVSFDCFGPGGPRDRTEFLNSARHGMMAEDYVARELPEFIDSRFRTKRNPDARALVGLSSGGYGAVNVGTKHQDVYRVLASHSGYFDPSLDGDHVRHMLGPKGPLWDRNDPHKQVGRWHGDPDLHIYLDCGLSDDLLSDNQRFDQELTASGVRHVLYVVPGTHRWSLWRDRLAYSLRYCDERFKELARK